MTEANHPASAERTLVSVVIVNWNTRDLLEDCLASVERHLVGTPHEVIVVDNGSTDGSAEFVARPFSRDSAPVNSREPRIRPRQ